MNRFLSLSLILLSLSGFTGKDSYQVKNYYGIPEVLTFDKTDFTLSGSYHPNDHYYKQEYIPAGQSPDHFNTMVIIDFYITDVPVKKLVELKERELDERKKDDKIVHYEQMENPDIGEYLLDFILSDAKGDKINVVERNVYRYKTYTDKSGHKGLLLMGISQRGYGDNITEFFKTLKQNRVDDINKVAAYEMPKIEIK